MSLPEPSFTTTFNPTFHCPELAASIAPKEIGAMRPFVGRLVKHYLITPKQAARIGAIAIAILSIACSYFLTPLAFLGLGLSTLLLLYALRGKDLHSKKGHAQQIREFAQVKPADLVQGNGLREMIDRDLSGYENPDDRVRHYILLHRLQNAVARIIAQSLPHFSQITQEKARRLEPIDTRFAEQTKSQQAFMKQAMQDERIAQQALVSRQSELQQLQQRLSAIALQAKVQHEGKSKPTSNDRAHEALKAQLLQVPELQRQIELKTQACERALLALIDKNTAVIQQAGYHNTLLLEHHRQVDEQVTSWERQQKALVEQAQQAALSQLEAQFRQALPYGAQASVTPV